MRWVVVSLVVHIALLLVLIAPRSGPNAPAPLIATQDAHAHVQKDPEPMVVEVMEQPARSTGGGTSSRHRGHASQGVQARPWDGVVVRVEQGRGEHEGQGQGQGQGNGDGQGIGFGSIHVEQVPAPPPAPEISKARPAKLIWPKRDEDVDDDANLFVAKITVDVDGDVVGARMTTTRPGAKADRAADAIWTFRYAPALDDRGNPVSSTFDQPFQVR